MGYMPTIYKFANPIHSAYRLYSISEPFFKGEDLEAKLKRPYKEILRRVKLDAKNKAGGVMPLELYLQGHEILVENFDKLKNYDIMIIPSVSSGLADDSNVLGKKSGKQGMDFFSNNIRLPNDILKAYQSAYDRYVKNTGKAPNNYQNELILPLAHFMSPLRLFRTSNGVFGAEFLFKSDLENISIIRAAEGKKEFGTSIRCSDDSFAKVIQGVEGNYEFSERIYLPGRAKTNEEKQYTFINRFLSSQGLLWILQRKDHIHWYAEKGKYMGLIKKQIPKEYQHKIIPVGGEQGILQGKNAGISGLGPSDEAALGLFSGHLYAKWLKENGVDVRPKRLGVRNAQLFA